MAVKTTTNRKQAARTRPSTPLSKHRQSEQTRSRLLQAAERIFARDGFEAAKLEEIAAAAGYTRGAFYANFDSKESLFVAMLEEKIQQRIQGLRDAADQFEDPTKKLQAMRDHFAGSAQDCDWILIGLEFKLFALRHPELRAKVAAMRQRILAAATSVLEEVFRTAKVKLPVSTAAFAVSLAALSNALELDRMLDQAVSEEEIVKIGKIFFDSMVRPRS